VEMLLGHDTGLSMSYYRPSAKTLLEDYLKAVDYLTINEENRLRKKVMEFTQKQSEIEIMNYEKTQELAAQLESKTQEIVALRDTMDAMDMRMSQEFEAKLDSETQIMAMHDYIEDMSSQMRELTKNFNMLKEMRDKDLEVLHRLLPESEKPGDIGRGKELTNISRRFERRG
jgi:predicted RNase H-like nuclease (RuvC/YqgF family)